jgi:hypothetical protein
MDLGHAGFPSSREQLDLHRLLAALGSRTNILAVTAAQSCARQVVAWRSRIAWANSGFDGSLVDQVAEVVFVVLSRKRRD